MISNQYSDYIIYVDESGDHSLKSIDSQYPIFVFSFCVFHKKDYINHLTPALRQLKFNHFGHDMIVLHELDIRRKQGAFSQLSKDPREAFLNQLTEIIRAVPFYLVAVVIDKRKLKERQINLVHPYHLALEFGLERIYEIIQSQGQNQRLTHIICEARGAKEDKELELEFRRLRDGDNYSSSRLPFDLIVADKKTNSEGLQIADLTARPVGLMVLRPEQSNRTAEVLSK